MAVHAVTLRNPVRPSAATAAILFELVAHRWPTVIVLPIISGLASMMFLVREGGNVLRRVLTGCRER
jgi:hypothetical protein